MVYQWRIPKYNVAAQAAGEELRRIELVHRVLRPADVVEESRDASAPLHGCFTWDDAQAAEKCRLREAGALIRNLQVTRIGAVAVTEPVGAFQSIREEGTGRRGYRSVDLVLSDPGLREQPRQAASRETASATHKFGALSTLTGAYRAVEIVRDTQEGDQPGPRSGGQ